MSSRLLALAAAHAGVATRAQARSLGVTDPELRRLVARGTLVRVRQGAYVVGSAWSAANDHERLVLRTRAMLATRPEAAACQVSTVALHGLPIHSLPTQVELTADVPRVRIRSGLRVRPRGGHPVVDLGGVPTVPLGDALAQLAVDTDVTQALVPVDAALHRGIVTPDAVRAGFDRLTVGSARVRDSVLELADPACESPGETLTRLLLRDLGYVPRSQAEIHDLHGRVVARVDFLVGQWVIVEFDGAVKYAGADGREALIREKAREDALRSLGYVVVRVTWSMLRDPALVARMVRDALARAR